MEKAHRPSSMPGYSLPVYEYRPPPELAKKQSMYPVVVVGAGLAGLTAALELGSRGVRTIVLDEDNTVGASGLSSRGICYAKRSLEIFDRFGVAARIRGKGVTWNEGEVFRGEERLYRFNLQPEADHKFPAFVNLQQFYVEQFLVERVQSMERVDLRWRNRVVALKNTDDAVLLEVETPDGKYEAKAQYVIAADGGHSTVRELLGARDEVRSLYDDRWCIADVKMESGEAQAVRKAYLDGIPTQGGAIWYHQMADGIWRTDWQIGHLADPDAETTPERATERLRKLVGPNVRFELVWVGPWRFKKRLLVRFVHGRVVFAGDAAHEHSPFGARGGNSAIQDANNLAWKLALVLSGNAHRDLLQTYDYERHYAARDNTESATRSAIFIGPATDGQRLFRNAILGFAQRHALGARLRRVRLFSVGAGLRGPRRALLRGPLRRRVARRLRRSLVRRARTRIAHQSIFVERAGNEALFKRYGVHDSATYVFRPDGHVLARCTGIDAAFAEESIRAVLQYQIEETPVMTPPRPATDGMSQADMDRLYDDLAGLVDGAPKEQRERVLARPLAIGLMQALASYDKAKKAIEAAAL